MHGNEPNSAETLRRSSSHRGTRNCRSLQESAQAFPLRSRHKKALPQQTTTILTHVPSSITTHHHEKTQLLLHCGRAFDGTILIAHIVTLEMCEKEKTPHTSKKNLQQHKQGQKPCLHKHGQKPCYTSRARSHATQARPKAMLHKHGQKPCSTKTLRPRLPQLHLAPENVCHRILVPPYQILAHCIQVFPKVVYLHQLGPPAKNAALAGPHHRTRNSRSLQESAQALPLRSRQKTALPQQTTTTCTPGAHMQCAILHSVQASVHHYDFNNMKKQSFCTATEPSTSKMKK